MRNPDRQPTQLFLQCLINHLPVLCELHIDTPIKGHRDGRGLSPPTRVLQKAGQGHGHEHRGSHCHQAADFIYLSGETSITGVCVCVRVCLATSQHE